MGKKGKSFTDWITGGGSGTKEGTPSKTVPDSSRDGCQKQNEELHVENETLQKELKKLREIVQQLEQDYESSKEFDPVRRYDKLKGMVKRAVNHVKLNLDEQRHSVSGPGGGVVGGSSTGSLLQGCRTYAKMTNVVKDREEKYSGMSKQELTSANSQLSARVRETRKMCSVLRDSINHLETKYQDSKRYAMMQRYGLLKDMVKTVVRDIV